MSSKIKFGTLLPLRLVRWSVQNKFFEGLVVIVSVVTMGLGTTFMFAAESYSGSAAFRTAFEMVHPAVWGIVMFGGSLGLLATALRKSTRFQGIWPGAGLIFTYIALAVAFLRSVPLGGVPSGVWIYMGFAFVYMWIIAACAFIDEEVSNGTAPARSVAHIS